MYTSTVAKTTMATLLVLLLLLSLSILFLKVAFKRRADNLPPGPTGLPIIGNLHSLINNFPHRSLLDLSRKHGPLFFLHLGTVPTVIISSSNFAKHFTNTHDHDCCSRPHQTATAKLSYGFLDAGFSPYGAHWRGARRDLVLSFVGPKSVARHKSAREDGISNMVNSIPSGEVVDVSHAVHAMSIDITCVAAFGRRGTGRLREAMEELHAVLAGFYFADYFVGMGWMDRVTGMRARLDKIYEFLDGFYDEIIDEHTELGRTAADREEQEDAVDVLLRIKKDITRDEIKALILVPFRHHHPLLYVVEFVAN